MNVPMRIYTNPRRWQKSSFIILHKRACARATPHFDHDFHRNPVNKCMTSNKIQARWNHRRRCCRCAARIQRNHCNMLLQVSLLCRFDDEHTKHTTQHDRIKKCERFRKFLQMEFCTTNQGAPQIIYLIRIMTMTLQLERHGSLSHLQNVMMIFLLYFE